MFQCRPSVFYYMMLIRYQSLFVLLLLFFLFGRYIVCISLIYAFCVSSSISSYQKVIKIHPPVIVESDSGWCCVGQEPRVIQLDWYTGQKPSIMPVGQSGNEFLSKIDSDQKEVRVPQTPRTTEFLLRSDVDPYVYIKHIV